jgi:ribosomal protein S18 acetylase RimI-like enzyme
MAKFVIYKLPTPASDHDTLLEFASRLKALRLQTLKEDPDSWISLHEREADQPQEFWLSRLKSSSATHLVLLSVDSSHDASEGGTAALLKGEWVGSVVILAPELHQDDTADHMESTSAEYLMASVSVRSDVRGQGLGKRLVQAAIQTARNSALEMHISSSCLTANVRHGNDHALQLYQKLGFRIIDPEYHGEKEGRPYTSNILRVDL